MTLGSLFSGSGGFELAGTLAGIKPLWNAEIEPFPSRVTAARFPDIPNLGDVTNINGGEIPPVDIITFGRPCQDLSVAGKQKGIHDGERSNLFFHAIRIIREMLEATNDEYPKYAVWENVPGAFSSNKGDDFRDVLQSFVDLRDPLSDVPKPKKWGGLDALWEMVTALPGVSTMLSIGVSPSVARESTLSQILETNAPERYCLSQRACQGILTRAARRGKVLPKMLKEALEEVVYGHLPAAPSMQK